MKHNNLEAPFGNPKCSGHSPISINTVVSIPPGRKPFRLLTILLQQDDFRDMVIQVWTQHIDGYAMFRVWKKLKALGAQAKHRTNLYLV